MLYATELPKKGVERTRALFETSCLFPIQLFAVPAEYLGMLSAEHGTDVLTAK
jgi:hypothetical protein